jgi:hypothetical protein
MSERDPRLFCDDILDSGNAILEFVEGFSFDDFCDDRRTYSAVISALFPGFLSQKTRKLSRDRSGIDFIAES